VVDARTGALTPVGRADLNVWDACWAGEQVLAVCSDGSSSESAWYSADLRLLDPATGEDRVVVTTDVQLGPVAASPSGRRVAWVESISSDRGLLCGDLHLLDRETGERRRLAAPLDVSDVAFVSEHQLGVAGIESLTTRVALVSTDDEVQVLWESLEDTAAGWGPLASFRPGAAAFYAVGFSLAPQLLLVQPDEAPRTLTTVLDAPQRLPGTSRVHRWTAPDGWEVEGWLHLPEGEGPHPLVVVVHGGPNSHYRTHWGAQAVLRPLLLEHGYAVLLPNVRGSNGRGQEYARAVVGDMPVSRRWSRPASSTLRASGSPAAATAAS
jgi:dipeptidyl aminopeptidase/acylaminoacyl peptidase